MFAPIQGFSLHQLQQMFDRILVFEVVYISTPSSHNTDKKNNILFLAADHKICHQLGQSEQLKCMILIGH